MIKYIKLVWNFLWSIVFIIAIYAFTKDFRSKVIEETARKIDQNEL